MLAIVAVAGMLYLNCFYRVKPSLRRVYNKKQKPNQLLHQPMNRV